MKTASVGTIIALLVIFGGGILLTGQAAEHAPDLFSSSAKSMKLDMSALRNISAGADIYEYVGDNIIARGHVVIKAKQLSITADSAIINVNTQDVEASGNVTFVRTQTVRRQVDSQEYRDLLDDVTKRVTVIRSVISPTGRHLIEVDVLTVEAYMKAERIAGNLITGAVRFRNFAMKTGALYAVASEAVRDRDGKITVKNARLTTCDYVMDDHDHYALTASKALIWPRDYGFGLRNYVGDQGDHSILALSPMLRLWDVPVLWLPALYKPMDTDSFGVDLEFGKSSDWGYWVRTSKGFTLNSDPYINVGAILDWYSDHGIAAGATATVATDNSRTEFFAYALHDRNPYISWDVTDSDTEDWYGSNFRFRIPKDRYDIKLSNLTHLTPRLDFRGQFELISDVNLLQDYFENRYKRDIQPPTYAALEYQFDRATASLYTTVHANSFDSTMQRLPQGEFDFQRQELFKGLYYQGSQSAGYYYMNWRQFDSRMSNKKKLENYGSGRFDSLNMFYYPFHLDFLNLIPRAGFRLTEYTATTSPRSDDDLSQMFAANNIDSGLDGNAIDFWNYRVSNQARLRFLSEFGLEANTKIYRSWNDVKSSWLGIDGLRHVMVPYINYTFIPNSNLSAEKTLYFDDVDRLKEQHYVRFGLTNRLQTRTGAYGSEQIREWASVETYWDYHMRQTDGFNNVGDLGTIFRFTPFDNLTLSSEMLWDIGANGEHDSEATRTWGKTAGRVGLDKLSYLDMWNTTLEYRLSKDWRIYGSYIYSDEYRMRSVYSMGTMIDTVNTATTSLSTWYPRSQWVNFGVDFPTYIDPKLKAGIMVAYDVDAALMSDAAIKLTRDFHCFLIGLQLGRKLTRNADGDKEPSYYVSGFISLSAMPGAKLSGRTNM